MTTYGSYSRYLVLLDEWCESSFIRSSTRPKCDWEKSQNEEQNWLQFFVLIFFTLFVSANSNFQNRHILLMSASM